MSKPALSPVPSCGLKGVTRSTDGLEPLFRKPKGAPRALSSPATKLNVARARRISLR